MTTPKPYRKKRHKYPLATVDIETDPFDKGRSIEPFALGYYDGETYVDFIGKDCVARFMAHLDDMAAVGGGERRIIYAHNGGKFDYMFFLPWLDKGQEPLLIGSRFVRAHFNGWEFRDSFALMPAPLKKLGGKLDINMSKMERGVRRKHMAEIRRYLKGDCVALYGAVSRFADMFGDRPTIASTALPMLRSRHGFETLSEPLDGHFRQFYFGGRVECFETGRIRAPKGRTIKIIDRNSMYPTVMAEQMHPVGAAFINRREIDERTDFARITAHSRGALPVVGADGELTFPHGVHEFRATGHEIRAGLETGTLRIQRVHSATTFLKRANFAEFVQWGFGERKAAPDKLTEQMWKFLLNSSYGKFGINPRNFFRYVVTDGDRPDDARPLYHRDDAPHGWRPDTLANGYAIWKHDARYDEQGRDGRRFWNSFKNVATAASITGASRADLWRQILKCERPMYCDTDSVACLDWRDTDIHPDRLGAWDMEAEGDEFFVAGKKDYALFMEGEGIKKAHKGKNLTYDEIRKIALGVQIVKIADAPVFGRDGSQRPLKRTAKRTGKVQPKFSEFGARSPSPRQRVRTGALV